VPVSPPGIFYYFFLYVFCVLRVLRGVWCVRGACMCVCACVCLFFFGVRLWWCECVSVVLKFLLLFFLYVCGVCVCGVCVCGVCVCVFKFFWCA